MTLNILIIPEELDRIPEHCTRLSASEWMSDDDYNQARFVLLKWIKGNNPKNIEYSVHTEILHKSAIKNALFYGHYFDSYKAANEYFHSRIMHDSEIMKQNPDIVEVFHFHKNMDTTYVSNGIIYR